QSVSVLYGRNEAGKTTLLQFLRTMLYGLTPDRQQRYLPPRGGGAAGGWLRVKTPTGTYRVHRQLDAQPITTEIADGQLRILPNDPGQEEKDQPGGQAWRVMLSGVDENTYRNVYAVGLREMQELATLSDSDAASYLYDLSAGLDRVSLVEVLRQLKQSRERLLNGSDPDAEIFRLLQRRDELQQQLHRVGQSLGRYHDLLAARTELAAEITRLEDKRREVAHRVRLAELASGLLPP
ncbi:MAG: AAA family ATPase, partial [Planctomycetales bacterium]|nr:AAA family ATPase [Planctomycetales bacterium]